jgi:hypothetical protein
MIKHFSELNDHFLEGQSTGTKAGGLSLDKNTLHLRASPQRTKMSCSTDTVLEGWIKIYFT